MRSGGYPIFGLGRVPCAALLTLAVGAVAAVPAGACEEEPKVPEYSIGIVEGVTTQPEQSILSTSASAKLPHDNHVELTLRIVHDGLTVAEDTQKQGGAWLSQVPQVGDTVYLEVPRGNVVRSVVYDGLPSMDPTVCAGSTNFSGQRSAGDEVEGSYFTLVRHPTYVAERQGESAQVTTLSGSSFSGSFLQPLAIGETVKAVEHLTTQLAGGGIFKYSSENDRPVTTCSSSSGSSVPPVVGLQGWLAKLARATIRRLIRHGWLTFVIINQPGSIAEDLYTENGTLPASAASVSKHGDHRPTAQLLASGSAKAVGAGTTDVWLRPTANGRAILEHQRRIKAVLVITLRTPHGATLKLGPRTVSLDA